MSFANEELFFANNSNVAIVGENGQGKTTLLRIVSGIVAPDSGIYKFDSKEFKFPLRKKIRKNGREFVERTFFIRKEISFYIQIFQ